MFIPRIWLASALIFAITIPTQAEEPTPRTARAEAAEPVIPVKESAAVEAAWNIKVLTKRLGLPGALGQHDAFWELLLLCESKPEAAKDSNVAALLDWLLFDAQLIRASTIYEPASAKLPRLIPALGTKVLKARLAFNRAYGDALSEPWTWPDFQFVDKVMLGNAIAELGKENAISNPVARISLAAGALACERENGAREYAEARLALEKNLPAQAKATEMRLVDSMLRAGVRQSLPLMIEFAEAEMSGQAPVNGENDYFSNSMSRVQQILGWQNSAQPNKNLKAELDKIKVWVAAHLNELSWDRAKQRFVSTAPPPGMEELYAAAQKVEAACGFKYLENNRATDLTGSLKIVDDFLSSTKDLNDAGATAITDLVTLIVDKSPFALQMGDQLLLKIDDLGTKLPALKQRIYALLADKALSSGTAYSINQIFHRKYQTAEVKKAIASLNEVYKERFNEKLKGNDSGAKILSAMQWLFVGGKLNASQFSEIMAKAPTEWKDGQNGKFYEWANAMQTSGRTGALRLQLLSATFNDTRSSMRQDPLRQFYQMLHWQDGLEGTREVQLAAAWKWLELNENNLDFDVESHSFTGAPPPDRAEIYAMIQKLPANYGIKPEEINTYNGLHVVRDRIINIIENQDRAAVDPAGADLLAALITHKKMKGELDGRVLRVLSKLPEATAVQIVADKLRTDINTVETRNSIPAALNFNEDLDRKLLAAARAKLLPEFSKRYDAVPKDKPAEALKTLLSSLFLGGTATAATLDDLIKQANASERHYALNWAEAITKTGQVSGLRVMLSIARKFPNERRQALARFEKLLGLERDRAFVNQYTDEVVETLGKWLDDNEKSLIWIDGMDIFRAPNAELPQFKIRVPQAVKPPAPPVEQKEQF